MIEEYYKLVLFSYELLVGFACYKHSLNATARSFCRQRKIACQVLFSKLCINTVMCHETKVVFISKNNNTGVVLSLDV